MADHCSRYPTCTRQESRWEVLPTLLHATKLIQHRTIYGKVKVYSIACNRTPESSVNPTWERSHPSTVEFPLSRKLIILSSSNFKASDDFGNLVFLASFPPEMLDTLGNDVELLAKKTRRLLASTRRIACRHLGI